MLTLIPIPYEYQTKSGVFRLDDTVQVQSDFALPLLECGRAEDGAFVIQKNAAMGTEEYKLCVTESGIHIEASCETGAYYALQTLRQLMKADLGKKDVPCCEIHDKPQWSWRGMSLDESRHFFGMAEVKRLLDVMFMMKLNVFHWHLTDDQGWRIEIKKYPLLTEIGAKRKYSHLNGWQRTDILNEPHEGFYTQEDIREIVAYAKERGIMVVPEIDMPAHFAAAMAAYPWLGCRELQREVPGYFGGKVPESRGVRDWNRPACMGKESTFTFIKDVIDEVCTLFDAPYFHIGGDEVPRDEWKKCPHCQKAIQENSLKNEDELQGWFNNRIMEYLKTKGKRLIGWNEILAAQNLDNSVVAQYWVPTRDRNVEKYLAGGGNVIMSKHQAFYFDMTYGQYPLKNTYDFSLNKYHIDPVFEKNIFGVEGEVWTEWIDGRGKLDVSIFPRMQALSEVGWSPESKKDFADFKMRLDDFKPTMDALGLGYAVDKISMAKGFKRIKPRKLFYAGDTHYELKCNNEYKLKGEK